MRKAPFNKTTYPRLLILAAYCILASLVVYRSGYYPPTKLAVSVKGPSPNTYSLYCESGGSKVLHQVFSVRKGGGDAELEFDLPDKRITAVALDLGYVPDTVVIKSIRLKGVFRERRWSPQEVQRDFEPTDPGTEGVLTAEGLSVRTPGHAPTLRSGPGFAEVYGHVAQARPYLLAIVIGLAVIACLTVPNTFRFASFLSFMLAVLSYVGFAGGTTNLSPVIFGGLFLLTVVELALGRREYVLVLMALFFVISLTELTCLVRESLEPPKPEVLHRCVPSYGCALDAELAAKPMPSYKKVESKTIGDVHIYDNVVYTTDEKGRRFIPKAGQAKRHAIFFGCSYTWGYGVGDAQTMPSYFQQVAKGEYQAYNYSFDGWAAGQMYQLLKDGSALDDVGQREGIAVYNFIGDHVYRATPWFKDEKTDFPAFRLDGKGELDGPFKIYERKGLRTWMRLFGEPNGLVREASPAIRYFLSRFPSGPISRRERILATAKVVVAAKELYDSRFKGDFYVVIWDKNYLTDDEIRRFARVLVDNGIRVMVVPRMPNPKDEDLNPLDEHPSSFRDRWVAEYFYRELKAPSRLNVDNITLTR